VLGVPRQSAQADISGLLDMQCGVVRRDQVVGTALTDGSLRWLLRSRQWQAVLPSIYASFSGGISDDQRTAAAQLYCGPDALLTGPGALRSHGMRYAPGDERVHMLVPHTCHVSSAAFVVVHRTRCPDANPVSRGFVRVASVARAVADTARMSVDLRVVRAIVAEAIQRRLTTVPLLVGELESGPRRGSALFRQALGEVADASIRLASQQTLP
jgi:hypothetical protein